MLPWLLKRTRLLKNACLFPKSRVAKHSYQVIMLSCHHTCMYLMPSTQLSKVCCCRTVVYIQRMLGHHASTLGTTQTHGTVLLVASGMSANRSKDSYKCTSRLTLSRVEPVLLLRRLCQCHWNDWPKYAQKAVTFSSSVQSVTNKSFWTVLLLNLLASWCNWLECRSCRKCRVYWVVVWSNLASMQVKTQTWHADIETTVYRWFS